MVAGEPTGEATPPGNWQQVSVFLSPMDVHVNRIPVSGRVIRVEYHPGRFLPAYKKESGDLNERSEVTIDHAGQPIVVRQIVGVLARRVVCRTREGLNVKAGERYGVMKFGSRMDVFVPADAILRVRVGDTVVGGVTVIATSRRGPRTMRVRLEAHNAVDDEHSQRRRLLRLRPLKSRPERARRSAAGSTCCRACSRWRTCSAATPASSMQCGGAFDGCAVHRLCLRPRHARWPHRADDRHDERLWREFDSLADVISFGVAPAILSFKWGLEPLGQIGWAAGFLFVAAAAVRLARFNIQAATQDKRYFVGLPSPAAAVVPAATVFAYPAGSRDTRKRGPC